MDANSCPKRGFRSIHVPKRGLDPQDNAHGKNEVIALEIMSQFMSDGACMHRHRGVSDEKSHSTHQIGCQFISVVLTSIILGTANDSPKFKAGVDVLGILTSMTMMLVELFGKKSFPVYLVCPPPDRARRPP